MRRTYELPPSVVEIVVKAIRDHKAMAVSRIVEHFGVGRRAVLGSLKGIPCVRYVPDPTRKTDGKFIWDEPSKRDHVKALTAAMPSSGVSTGPPAKAKK